MYLTSKRAYPFHFLLVPNLWPTSKEIKSLVTPNCYLKDSIQPNWVKANGCFRLLWTMRLLRVGVGVGVGKKKYIQFCEGVGMVSFRLCIYFHLFIFIVCVCYALLPKCVYMIDIFVVIFIVLCSIMRIIDIFSFVYIHLYILLYYLSVCIY